MRFFAIIFMALTFVSVNSNIVFSEDQPSLEALIEDEKLNMELQYLRDETFVITATKTLENIKKTGASVTVITNKELREMGAKNVMDALRRVPGFDVTLNNLGWDVIEARGIKASFSDKILFMMNSHPANLDIMFGGVSSLAGSLVVENVKRIEIIRGPGSALHGTSAFLAVVNIITKDAEDIDGIEVTAGGGSFETQRYNLLYGKTINGVDIAANLNFFDTNGFDGTVEEDAQTILDQVMGTNVSLAPGPVNTWERKSDFELKLKYRDFEFFGKYILRDKGNFIGLVSALDDSGSQNFDGYIGRLIYTKDINKDFSVETKIYRDFLSTSHHWGVFPPGFAGIFPDGFNIRSGFKNAHNGGEIIGRYDINESNKLVVGMMGELQQQWDIEFDANHNPLTNAPLDSFQDVTGIANWNISFDRTVLAAYVEDIWDINDDWRLILGGRFDHYSDFGNTFNPRASVIWSLNEDYTMRFLYGSAFRAPTANELFSINNPAVLGNPDLNPEEIDTFEFGIDGEITDNLSSRITFFYNSFDEIILPSVGDTVVDVYENVGDAEVKGIEFELKMRFEEGSYIGANYTYQDTENGQTGQPMADTPAHKANIMANLNISEYLNWYTSLFLKGKTPREVGDTREDVDGYGVVNTAFIVKNFFKKAEGLEITMSINNVFDKDYVYASPIDVLQSDYPTPGRNFFLELRYAF